MMAVVVAGDGAAPGLTEAPTMADPSEQILAYIDTLERRIGNLELENVALHAGQNVSPAAGDPEQPGASAATGGSGYNTNNMAAPKLAANHPSVERAAFGLFGFLDGGQSGSPNSSRGKKIGGRVALALERKVEAEKKKLETEEKARTTELNLRKTLNSQVEREHALGSQLRQAEERETRAVERRYEVEVQLKERLSEQDRRAQTAKIDLDRTVEKGKTREEITRSEAKVRVEAQKRVLQEEQARLENEMETEREKSRRFLEAAEGRTKAALAVCQGELSRAEQQAATQQQKAETAIKRANLKADQMTEASRSRLRLLENERDELNERSGNRLRVELKEHDILLEQQATRDEKLRHTMEERLKEATQRAVTAEERQRRDATECALKQAEAEERVRLAHQELGETLASYQLGARKVQEKAAEWVCEVQRLSEELDANYAQELAWRREERDALAAKRQAELQLLKSQAEELVEVERTKAEVEILRMNGRVAAVQEDSSVQFEEAKLLGMQDVGRAKLEQQRVAAICAERVAQANDRVVNYLKDVERVLPPKQPEEDKQAAWAAGTPLAENMELLVDLQIDLYGRFSPTMQQVLTDSPQPGDPNQ